MSEEEKKEDSNKPIYIVDEKGSIPPEVAAIVDMNSWINGVQIYSNELSNALVGLRQCAQLLNRDPGEGDKVYNFHLEPWAKEELKTIAGFLEKLNYKVWGVTRRMGTEVGNLSDRIDADADEDHEIELREFLESDPPLKVSPLGDKT